MTTAVYRFPTREVDNEKWCWLNQAGIKRIDVACYSYQMKENVSFAGGHRHRVFTVWDSIHVKFPPGHEIVADIKGVDPSKPPPQQKQRHNKGGRR